VEGYLSCLNDFKKCHRCWLVNTQKIKAISGNSKGYFLLIEGVEFKIPVSRNFIADFRNSES
jgi:DNA-binding LytR/AlgR family response regulator